TDPPDLWRHGDDRGPRRQRLRSLGRPDPRRPLMARLYISIVSVWVWFVLGACLLLWLPVLAVVRVVTAPFDRGRYWVGLLFRQVAVDTSTLHPLWRFRVTGILPKNPRHPYVAVSNHESFVD